MNTPFFPTASFPRPGLPAPAPFPSLSGPRPLSHKVQTLLALPVERFKQQSPLHAPEPVTYAHLLLDESGSMQQHRDSALEGFNAQVGVIREGAKGAGRTQVGLTTFSSTPTPKLMARPVEELVELTRAQYNPNGGTALFDALGETLEALLEQPHIHAPTTAVLVAMFTDGQENASRRFTGDTLKALVTRLEATGRWTFTLMGPQGTSVELASVLNLSSGNVASFNPQDVTSTRSAFGAMAAATESYMSLRSKGVTASASLYAGDERA